VILAARIFAVLAAALLVAAFALAALAPDDLNLADGLALLNHDWLVWIPKHTVYWLWEWIERPLLVRPVWLLPAAFGLICGGAALTLNSRPPSRSHRRRS
jgi:hypothetical protein